VDLTGSLLLKGTNRSKGVKIMTDLSGVDPGGPVRPVEVGDAVLVVDEQYVPRQALVTAVHGGFAGPVPPSINVAYIATDPSARDPYGGQVLRLSSLAHYLGGPNQMPTPGRYWINRD
jgi:hypothetical protein